LTLFTILIIKVAAQSMDTIYHNTSHHSTCGNITSVRFIKLCQRIRSIQTTTVMCVVIINNIKWGVKHSVKETRQC